MLCDGGEILGSTAGDIGRVSKRNVAGVARANPLGRILACRPCGWGAGPVAMRSSLGERGVPYPSLSEGWSLAITPRVAIAVSLLFTMSATTASKPQRQGCCSGGMLRQHSGTGGSSDGMLRQHSGVGGSSGGMLRQHSGAGGSLDGMLRQHSGAGGSLDGMLRQHSGAGGSLDGMLRQHSGAGGCSTALRPLQRWVPGEGVPS